MPHSKKRSSTAYDLSEVLASPRLPLAVDSSTAISPSTYCGGTVNLIDDTVYIITSIVSQPDYLHLSPEELRFRDLEIHLDPPRWELSYEEEHLRYYLDEGLTSVPRFGSPTIAPAFSFASWVKPAFSDSASSYLGLGCPAPGTSVEVESATSTCSLCAARLAVGDEVYEVTSEGSGRDTPTSNVSRHQEWKRMSRRVRRLEKTVESLSHKLTLALTELQGRTITADGRKTEDSDAVDALSTALAGLSTVVDHPQSNPSTSAPDATLHHSSEPPDLMSTRCESASTSTNHEAAENNDFFVIENDCIRDSRSPISGLLQPILDDMACPEVHRFLKWAEAHPGLRNTQLFEELWVSNNLFNVHGGIMIYCLQKSLIFMDSISAKSESSAWSQDPELMQRLDKIYCKYLRPHIDTDGSRNGVAKAAWRSYCYGLSRVFSSKYFPDWESVKPSFKNLQDNDCFGPMITSSYIDDLSALWTEVHPALLEVTRWLEPFIDYKQDYHRVTPLFDATIALGRHARELFNTKGGFSEPEIFSTLRANDLMRFLCEHRSGALKNMQREMDSIMNRIDLRDDVETKADTGVDALVDRAKQTTLWRVSDDPREVQVQDTLARREIHVMRSYRPKLLRASSATTRIRSDVLDVLMKTGRGADAEEGEVFWDGCDASQ